MTYLHILYYHFGFSTILFLHVSFCILSSNVFFSWLILSSYVCNLLWNTIHGILNLNYCIFLVISFLLGSFSDLLCPFYSVLFSAEVFYFILHSTLKFADNSNFWRPHASVSIICCFFWIFPMISYLLVCLVIFRWVFRIMLTDSREDLNLLLPGYIASAWEFQQSMIIIIQFQELRWLESGL